MITTFRHRKKLVGILEVDFIAEPDKIPLVLKERRRIARIRSFDEETISICAESRALIHNEAIDVGPLVRRRKRQDKHRATMVPPEEIKAIREGLGFTQAEFASRLHVSLRSVQHWEQPVDQTGYREPRGIALAAIKAMARELERQQERKHPPKTASPLESAEWRRQGARVFGTKKKLSS